MKPDLSVFSLLWKTRGKLQNYLNHKLPPSSPGAMMFFIFRITVCIDELPMTLPTNNYLTLKGRYQVGAKCYDYLLALNIDQKEANYAITKCYLVNYKYTVKAKIYMLIYKAAALSGNRVLKAKSGVYGIIVKKQP